MIQMSILTVEMMIIQCRSSAPKSGGGGHKFFFPKSENQKKKKKKGHSGIKGQDRILWIGEGLSSNALFIRLLGYILSVLKWY